MLTAELASMLLDTPPVGMLIVPLPVIGPPVRPAPVLTVVTVPLPVPGKVCPEAKLITPLLAMESPVSAGVLPFDPKSRFNVPDGFEELFPVGSACQRKFCVTGKEVLLLYADACRSNGLEMNPWVAVADPVLGIQRLPRRVCR